MAAKWIPAKGSLWSSEEIQCLLEIWAQESIQSQLDNTHKNAEIFCVIREYLNARGYNRTMEQCRAKLKKMRLHYQKVRNAVRKSGTSTDERDKFPWYDAVDSIIGRKPTSKPNVMESQPIKPPPVIPPTSPPSSDQSNMVPGSLPSESPPLRPPPSKRRKKVSGTQKMLADLREVFREMDGDFHDREEALVQEQRQHDERMRWEAMEWQRDMQESQSNLLRELLDRMPLPAPQPTAQRFTATCDAHKSESGQGEPVWPYPLSPSLLHSTTGSSMGRKKLLMDVDCGVDDAQAIMMALAAPNVDLLGITCVHGNTSVENVCKNTLRVLQACGRLEIPVFRGTAKPILGNTIHAGHFHGQDGLGDAPDPHAPGLEMIQQEGAVPAMIRIINEHPGEVSLVATAPLTNLALAVRMDPALPSKLKGLFIMGGNTESRGNTTVCGEFNFTADPEAAYIVLNEFVCPTYLACWEFTCYSKLSWEFCDTWLAQDTEKARFMARIFRHSMEKCFSERIQKVFVGGSGFVSCDSYAMAAAIDDAFVTDSDDVAVSVELTGTHTRGMMVLDTLDILKKTHKATIMKKVDMEKFKQLMMDALK